MNDEASDARKTAPAAISAGCPQRCIGTRARAPAPPSGASRRNCVSSVSIHPGNNVLTRIPAHAHSTATLRVKEMIAAFAAP